MKRRIYLVIEARDYEIRAAKDCARRNGECIYHTFLAEIGIIGAG